MEPRKVTFMQAGQPSAPPSGARFAQRLGRLAPSRRIAGPAVIGSLLVATVVITMLLAPRPAPVVATPNFSAVPQGLTDYQGLFTTQLRPTYSAVPQGLTDYQHLRTAPIAAANHSEVPHGFTDYQGLVTQPLRPNYSQVPNGLTDYQRRSK